MKEQVMIDDFMEDARLAVARFIVVYIGEWMPAEVTLWALCVIGDAAARQHRAERRWSWETR